MTDRSRRFPSPSECPVCGADVPPHSRSCPGCGADEKTGWDEEATRYDGIDLPDSAFGDDSHRDAKPHSRQGVSAVTWVIVLLLLSALLLAFVFGRF